MKWRVVGWTYYDSSLQEGDWSWAVHNAIVDDVKKNGYLFSGFSHQEGYNCVPVLNDGKARRFTQRSWGGIIAEARGYTGGMDYVKFAFMMERDKEIRPQIEFDENSFTPETDLNESFVIEVSQNDFDGAVRGGIKLDDLIELRYLDVGDTLVLRCGEQTAQYVVAKLEREKDLTEDELLDWEMKMHDFSNDKKRKQAQKEFDEIKVVLKIKFKKSKKQS